MHPTSHSGFTATPLREHARKELIDLLDSVRGKKGLVIDPFLSGPLSLVAEFSLLKEHGVEKIYHLTATKLETDCKSLIYIAKPKLEFMRFVAEQIRTHTATHHTLCFVPRRTMICERVLEEEGVYGDVTIREFHLDMVPLEDDLLSLEMDGSFRELFLDGDTTSVYSVAKAIMKLQTVFGIIPRILGKGNYARLLADLLLRMRRELEANAEDQAASSRIFPVGSEIDSMIIIDRSVDLITPMCTQLTYEGLIDEVFGIKSTFVELDPSIAGVPAPAAATGAGSSSAVPPVSNKPKKVPLNSADKLYAQLRDFNFAVVGGMLNTIARRISNDYEGRHTAKTVSEIRDFIGRLGTLQAEHLSLRLHTGVAEQISKFTTGPEFDKMLEVQQNFVAGIIGKQHIDYIEELIDKQAPLMPVLRLLCLYSLVDGGVKGKYYENFRRELIQTYGYPHIITLQNLTKLGLFRRQDAAAPASTSTASAPHHHHIHIPHRQAYPAIRKAFKLIVDDVNEHNPNDISYVYSGYAPLSVRMVQAAVGGLQAAAKPGAGGAGATVGWKGWEEPLRLVGGTTVEEVQKVVDGGGFAKRKTNNHRTTLVVFLGGCTYTEVSALRFLSLQEEGHREFVTLTTQMINGTSMLESLVEKFEKVSISAVV
ncbi:hypothetical protein HK104_002652 [Borealophlyctis nickersoniae]|nr:hypothetical protein HK104_002652 [Borealophlyctis nickersoniae]